MKRLSVCPLYEPFSARVEHLAQQALHAASGIRPPRTPQLYQDVGKIKRSAIQILAFTLDIDQKSRANIADQGDHVKCK